ncbi:ankyrin repeat domain-containing protein SOWAHA-like isoform X2 [Watersipora subatra]|uniref:ankyrin repeat domain-containing protein SOWAHA-like isoform X2 n=1 Tax=Watersipora subatra TaxID=2589382 RepID=UPI00355C5A77
MHWAAKHGKPDVIKLLNGYQVDASLKSYCGYTPLHLAAMGNREECIELLVNLCKVQTSARDFYGMRPKQYLKKTCSTRIQQMLASNARQSFAFGNTAADEASVFARTQSFSAKIMKSTQGFAKKFGRDNRSASEAAYDRPDAAYSPEPTSKFNHNLDSRSVSQYTLSTDSGRGSLLSVSQPEASSGVDSEELYAISRSESTPNFPPTHDNIPQSYTNIQ